MTLVHDGANINEEEHEDRISNLPNDIIHHILSFLDTKFAVQTGALSRKWEHIWTSTRVLNLNSHTFRTLPLFAKFVKRMLSHRSPHVDVSKVQITFTGASTPFVVKSIVHYAYLHNVGQLNVTWLTKKYHQFPQCLFASRTLKHLTLVTSDQFFYLHKTGCVPKLAWDFPVLETVFLGGMHLGDKGDESLDLFSKCVNLKDLTLHKCCMYGLKIFNIYAPGLANLSITDAASFPSFFNVIAPQLQNLTASVRATINRFPFKFDSLQLITEGFESLENVNLSLSVPHYEQKRFVSLLLDLFRRLRTTKHLVLNLGIIETLSLSLDQLALQPCAFDNLKSLKVKMVPLNRKDHMVPIQVRNYLLEKSPRATFIMDLPQVTQKRSRQQVQDETMAKKVTKLMPEKLQPHTLVRHPHHKELLGQEATVLLNLQRALPMSLVCRMASVVYSVGSRV
ncbi:hypothetical protein R6Q59_015145 [Mikania micrantha]